MDEAHSPALGRAAADEADEHRQDVEWIREIRSGHSDAFAHIVKRYGPRLYPVLYRFVRNAEDVDDLLQETFVRAFRALDQFDPTRALLPWLRKIAVNVALNELQRRKRRPEIAEPDPVLDVLPARTRSDARLEARELGEAVEEGLEQMPIEWAAVFRLRAMEGLSYAEIAESLDMPMGSVMSRLARARARLAESLRLRYGPREEASP